MKISDLKGDIKVISGSPIGARPSMDPTATPSLMERAAPQQEGGFMNNAKNFATGVAKGELSTLKGLSDIGQGVARTLTRPFIGSAADETPQQKSFNQNWQVISTPQGTAENVGFGTEKLAEFLLPAANAAKAEQAITLMSAGIKSPLLAAGARVLGKSAVQGLASGGVRFLQSGGDLQETKRTALTSGITRGAFAVIGEGIRALHIPERMYSMIFKNSAKDMLAEMRANGIEALRLKDPDKFASFVSKGIINVDKSGRPFLNDTLAEQALDKGLRGSIRGMANTVVEKTLDAEDDVRRIASTYKGTVDLKEPQFGNVLKGIAQEYEDVGFGEISKEASRLADSVKAGQVSAQTALDVRRLLDKVRIASSFEKPASKLSLTQANLKTLADTVRSRLNSLPEMGKTMKDYSFYIDALEALALEAKRRGNNQVLSLIDSLFLSGALGAENQFFPVTAGIMRRIFLSGPGITSASLIRSGNLSPLASGLLGGGSSALQSRLGGLQSPEPEIR